MSMNHWLATVALGLTMAGCGASGPQTVPMTVSKAIPAAQGTIKSASISNGNTSLEVQVHHMAAPERVEAGATTYVVWVQALGQRAPQNLGAIRIDDDLHGSLKTVTPLRSFNVFITAEPSSTAAVPTTAQLLTASVQR